ncbi:cation efflux system protein CusB precursor [mine drainage metagenome]|uniref:Cation efflux system protein CusB n=1 Tax=mine drainage metagenome TaxID=410659 RepID=A0A1J5SV57_9ZZZZ
MKRSVIWVLLLLSSLVSASIAGYWLATVQMKKEQLPDASPVNNKHKVLYYRNPMGLADTSPVPKKDSMGMDYTPVYADNIATDSAIANTAETERKILYYRNPMGLPDTSPVPKQDSMGMDYTPVYADEQVATGQVKISTDKVQKLGVRTEQATLRKLVNTVRAVGQFQIDEQRLATVTAKFEGYIENLYVNATGQPVKRGQPLMQVYSPELVSAQEEYLIALNGRKSLKNGTEESLSGVDLLAESALKRLRNWDISDAQLQRLQKDGKATHTLTLYSPANGFVLEKTAVQGMRFMPGEPLFKIADLSTIWLLADVFEQDLALVHVGQTVNISVDAYPNKALSGKVAYIYPTISPETRTAKVRIELANSGGILRPDMYASMQLMSGHNSKVLAVPDSAIIDSGTRQIVLIQLAEGLFEPREIKVGMHSDGYTEVLEGLGEGETVVVRANFLIDAESNLKAALGSFGEHQTKRQATATSSSNTAPATNHEGH